MGLLQIPEEERKYLAKRNRMLGHILALGSVHLRSLHYVRLYFYYIFHDYYINIIAFSIVSSHINIFHNFRLCFGQIVTF